jgi:hypothetical protein
LVERLSRRRAGLRGRDVRLGCAPCKGGAFQWVQVPGAASKAADLGGERPLPSIAHSDG